MKRAIPLYLCSLAMLTGCGMPTIKGDLISSKAGAEMPDLVAILPPDNQSNDLSAVEVIQRSGGVLLTSKGYYGIANKAQDEDLRKIGLTDGGQLRAFKAADLCKALGVQGLLYSTVEDFNEINIGFWMSKKVKIKYALTDSNGDSLWEGTCMFRVRQITINPQSALQNFAQRKVGELVEKALRVHLVPESNMAAMKLAEKVTPWPDLASEKK